MPKRKDLTSSRFLKDYAAANRPLIILAAGLGKFTMEFHLFRACVMLSEGRNFNDMASGIIVGLMGL